MNLIINAPPASIIQELHLKNKFQEISHRKLERKRYKKKKNLIELKEFFQDNVSALFWLAYTEFTANYHNIKDDKFLKKYKEMLQNLNSSIEIFQDRLQLEIEK